MFSANFSNRCNEWPDFIKAIQRVAKEVYFDYTKQQINRSIKMFKDYIAGNILEDNWSSEHNDGTNLTNGNGLQSETIIPDWDSYMKARLGSVGGQMTLQLIEYAKNISLIDQEWNHPLMKSLLVAVSEEMIMVNDHLTFRKEVAEANFKFSNMRHAYTVLVHNKGKYDLIINSRKNILKKN